MKIYETKTQIDELKRTNYIMWLALHTQAEKCDKLIRLSPHPISKKYVYNLATGVLLPGIEYRAENFIDPASYFSPYAPEEENRPNTARFKNRLCRLREAGVLQYILENGKRAYRVNPAWLDNYSEPVIIRPADPMDTTPAEPAQPEPTQPATPPLDDLLVELASLPIAEVKLRYGEQEVYLQDVNLEAVYRVAKTYKETFGAATKPSLNEQVAMMEPELLDSSDSEELEDETDAPF